jgi:antitoxin component of RelBE/YafQ-DinJ toxin-antitoxin module
MNVQVATRVPADIKEKAAKYAAEIGLDLPTILRMSLYQVANYHRLPIDGVGNMALTEQVAELNADTTLSPKRVPPELLEKIRKRATITEFRAGKNGALVPVGEVSPMVRDWIMNG